MSRQNRIFEDFQPAHDGDHGNGVAPKTHLPPLGYRQGISSRRRLAGRAAWGVLILAALVVAGAAWYASPKVRQQVAQLAELPEIQDSLSALGERLGAAEQSARQWTIDRRVLQEQARNLDQKVSSNLEAARRHAQTLANDVRQRVRGELLERAAALEARLEHLETGQSLDANRVVELQQEVSSLRREIEVLNRQMAAAREGATRDAADLRERLDGTDSRWSALEEKFSRRRVDFEVARNSTQELTPGIALHLTGTNVKHRRFHGWIRLTPEATTLWIRDQGLNQPVTFYSRQNESPGEIVITRVTENQAVGYLLFPDGGGQAALGEVSVSPTSASRQMAEGAGIDVRQAERSED